MLLITEIIISCLLFHLLIYILMRRDPSGWVDDYPPEVGRIALERGLVSPSPYRDRKALVLSKLLRGMLFSVILGLLMYFLNGEVTFLGGFLSSYAIFFSVAWYDALVMDCIWCCHSPRCRIPGTDDLADLYCDYGFHLKQSVLGSLLGIPVCAVSGLFVMILGMVM